MKKRENKTISLFALLVLLVSGFAAVFLTTVIVVFTSIYKNTLVQNAMTSSEQAVSQVVKTLNLYSDDMRESMELLTGQLQREKDPEAVQDYMDMVVKVRKDLSAVFVYGDDGSLLLYGSGGLQLKPYLNNNLSFDQTLFQGQYGIIKTAPHVQNAFEGQYPWVVTVAARVYAACFGRPVYVAMDIPFSKIAAYVNQVGIGQHGYCYVTGTGGGIIYHPQQQLLFSGLKDELLPPEKLSDGTFVEQNTIYTVQALEDRQWSVVGVSMMDELAAVQEGEVILIFCAVAACVLLVTLLLLAILSKTVSRPIRGLVKAMKEFERNAESFQYNAVSGVREISVLSESFGHMVMRIQALVEKVKNEEIILRKTELKALQAQINPHFLYNTLDSIQWMCEQGKMQESVQMVSALAKLFRISINRGSELVTVEQELNHAKSYLLIQSFRYRNQFRYRFEVDDSVLQYLCNKITIQPLVENAIYHGIDRMIDEGEIIIRAKSDGDDVVFEVCDNGIGMTAEQCRQILLKDVSGSGGIGIKNVNDRLQIYFGAQYGLKIHSVLDEGTTVTVRFPKIKEGEHGV